VTDPDLVRVAYHEAGHLAMAWVLGRPVGAASIEPTEHYTGIAFHGRGRRPTIPPGGVVHLPVVLWPAGLRRTFEIEALIALAGEMTADLIPAAAARAEPPSIEPMVAKMVPLCEPETRQLEAAAATEHQSDWESANELVGLMTWSGVAASSYLNALIALATDIVRSARFRQPRRHPVPRTSPQPGPPPPAGRPHRLRLARERVDGAPSRTARQTSHSRLTASRSPLPNTGTPGGGEPRPRSSRSLSTSPLSPWVD
jgi:hypothetical protein